MRAVSAHLVRFLVGSALAVPAGSVPTAGVGPGPTSEALPAAEGTVEEAGRVDWWTGPGARAWSTPIARESGGAAVALMAPRWFQPAPELDLDGFYGRLRSLGYLGGRVLVLEFWATWCENCEALHPRMLAAHERFWDRVDFFAIAVGVGQSERRVRGHLAQHPVPYPTLWDGGGEAVRSFETPATSYIVILDDNGRVAYTGLGRDQDVDRAIREVLEHAGAD